MSEKYDRIISDLENVILDGWRHLPVTVQDQAEKVLNVVHAGVDATCRECAHHVPVAEVAVRDGICRECYRENQ